MSAPRAWLLYTALRLLVFACCAVALFLTGLSGLPLLAFAVLASSVVSLFVLKPQRTALVQAQEDRRQRRAEQRRQLRERLDDSPAR